MTIEQWDEEVEKIRRSHVSSRKEKTRMLYTRLKQEIFKRKN